MLSKYTPCGSFDAPWDKKYLIWKAFIVVWNPKLSVGVAALLHCTTPLWKVLISLYKQAKQRYHMNLAVDFTIMKYLNQR